MAEHGPTEDLEAAEGYARQFEAGRDQLKADLESSGGGVAGFVRRLTDSELRHEHALRTHYKKYSLGMMNQAHSGAEADAAFLREHIEVAAAAADRVAELQRQAQPSPDASLEEVRARIEHSYRSGREAAVQAAVAAAGDEDLAPVRTAQAAQTAYDRAFLERTA